MGWPWTIPFGSWVPLAGITPARRLNQALVVMHLLPTGIDVQQLRRDAHRGEVSVDQLLDVIDKQQHGMQGMRREIQRLRDRLAQYEPEVRSEGSAAKQIGRAS